MADLLLFPSKEDSNSKVNGEEVSEISVIEECENFLKTIKEDKKSQADLKTETEAFINHLIQVLEETENQLDPKLTEIETALQIEAVSNDLEDRLENIGAEVDEICDVLHGFELVDTIEFDVLNHPDSELRSRLETLIEFMKVNTKASRDDFRTVLSSQH